VRHAPVPLFFNSCDARHTVARRFEATNEPLGGEPSPSLPGGAPGVRPPGPSLTTIGCRPAAAWCVLIPRQASQRGVHHVVAHSNPKIGWSSYPYRPRCGHHPRTCSTRTSGAHFFDMSRQIGECQTARLAISRRACLARLGQDVRIDTAENR
jgi:hypothetical protein